MTVRNVKINSKIAHFNVNSDASLFLLNHVISFHLSLFKKTSVDFNCILSHSVGLYVLRDEPGFFCLAL